MRWVRYQREQQSPSDALGLRAVQLRAPAPTF